MRTTVLHIRTIVLISFLLFSSLFSFSQSITSGNGKYELGVGIGPLFFLGDLGGNYGKGGAFVKDVNLPITKICKGAYANFYPTEWLGIRVALNQGVLEGNDSLVKDKGGAEASRKQRNLQFQTNMFEGYAAVEFYPTVFLEKYDGLQGKIRPYGLMGLGIFKFNPKGKYFDPNGNSYWVPLQPLRLEGQGMAEYPDRKVYKLTAIEIPVGIGFKYYFRENKYIGLEILHRKSNSDYVDDVSTTYIDGNLFDKYLSPDKAAMARQLYYRENFVPNGANNRINVSDPQRGNSKNNDSYFSSVIRLGWRLNDINSPSGRAARQLRCPSFY